MLLALLLMAAPSHAADGDDDDGDGLSNAREQELGTSPTRIDSDGDYLSDGEEVQRGTHPKLSDTDSDGLPDYSEIAVHRTDPLQKDSDKGGTIDGEEVRVDGTNPRTVGDDRLDSDDDGLPNAVEEKLGTDPFARDSDGDLLLDGEEDANADGARSEVETDPTRLDTDEDGVPDGVEVRVYGSDPLVRDSDDDGLTDGDEDTLRIQGADCLDPTLADSDHDGLTDADELSEGHRSDPCLADGDGDGIYDVVERADDTDPGDASAHKPDRDGDHLSDAYEAAVSHTDPAAADSDGDALNDGEELFALADLRQTNPLDADSDDDGLLDGSESRIVGERVRKGSDPLLPDTDSDGLLDGQELGLSSPESSPRDPDATRTDVFRADDDPASKTDPLRADTDGDALGDGAEDRDHDGVRDASETDPLQADTDLDGLDDGWEAKYEAACGVDPLDQADAPRDLDGDGLSNRQEYEARLRTAAGTLEISTSPCAADTDADGLSDRQELRSDYGSGQSDPTRADSDGDGLADGVEDRDGDGRFQEGLESDPTRADTDGDRLSDGAEDRSHDGEVGPDETDPRRSDSDDDGIDDGRELELFGTNPTSEDSDDDGLRDGLELALRDDADPLTSTDPRNADTDADGLSDGDEDRNHDGAVDASETHPRLTDTERDRVSDREEVGEAADTPADFDGDGVIDARDDDSDADGVSDRVEAGDDDLETPRPDTDGDGNNDLQDVDSDNGGVLDGVEENQRKSDRLDASDDGRGWFEAGSSVRGSGCAIAAARQPAPGWLIAVGLALVWRRRRLRWSAAVAGALLPLMAAGQEHPDARRTAVDGSPYRVNPSGEKLLETSLPDVLAPWQWQVRLVGHHFADSIVIADASGERQRSILADRQQLELGAALGLFGFAELSAHWAVALHQSATFPAAGLGATDAFGVTHPVLHPKLMLLRQPKSPLGFGLEVPVTLGAWKPHAYMGRDGWSARPAALLSWQWRALTAAVSVGVDFLPSVRIHQTRDGSRFVYRAALQYALPEQRWRVAVEWSASHRLGDPWDRDEQTGQIAIGVGYRILPGWTVDAAVGGGVLAGIGQPSYRVLVSTAHRSPAPMPEPHIERAPEPEPERALEAAPAPQPPAPAGDSSTPALAAEDPAAITPPPPSAPEPPPTQDLTAELERTRIAFSVAGSALDPETRMRLDRVLQILEDQPALRVRIEGHSDALGDRRANEELSLRRASAVRAYLIEHSRDPRAMDARLEHVGYGEQRPIDTNDTETGRARNRHVSFVLLR